MCFRCLLSNQTSQPVVEETSRPHYAPHPHLLPTHMSLWLDFTAFKTHTLRARNTLTITSSTVTRSKSLVLNAVGMNIISVSGAKYSYNSTHLQLVWETEFEMNESRQVSVEYSVSEPVGGLYFATPCELYDRAVHCITDSEPGL